MRQFYRGLSLLSGIFVWSMVILRTTDGSSITWNKPPPSDTVTDPAVVSKTNKNLTKGSLNEELSCDFSLTADLSVLTVTMDFGVNRLVFYVASTVVVESRFKDRGNATWIPTKLTLILFNVTTAEAGIYCCKVSTAAGTWTREIEVTVLDQSRITFISENQTVNDGDLLWLNCSAMGTPQPIRTWTRLSDNRTVDMPFTITGKQDEGGYICTADNKVGNAATSVVFVTVESYRPSNTYFSTNLTNSASINETFYLMCSAEANPAAKYRLYKEDESIANITATSQNIGLYATAVSDRVKEVVYKCIPFNSFGDGPTKNITVTLHWDPDTISLIANVTENANCSDLLWVNFTCKASEANPPVQSYQLLKNGELLDTATNGTWTREISEAGKHVYSCMALHFLGNVNRSNGLTVTFNAPALVTIANETIVVLEGGNVTLHCGFSGFPLPNVSWINNSMNYIVATESILKLPNISRYSDRVYTCSANNACGNDSKNIEIDVQYPVEATGTGTNATVAEGAVKSFLCPVDGNPEPNIKWYKGSKATGKPMSMEKVLTVKGVRESVCYTCVAYNLLGTPVNISQCLIVDRTLTTVSSTTVSQQRGEIHAFLKIITNYEQAFRDLNSASSKEFVSKFVEEMDKVYWNVPEYISTEVTRLRAGSVIVYFTIYFKTVLTPERGLEKLRLSISNGTFGDFQAKDLGLSLEESTKSTTTTEIKCTCTDNETTLLIVIGVLVTIIILLIAVIIWQHRKLRIIGSKRPYDVPEERDAGFYDNEVAMKDLNPTHLRPKNSAQQQNPNELAYMPLRGICPTGEGPITPERPAPNVEYAPLDMRTRSWEVARDDVKVEKAIGKGAFGQVAKGTAKNLRFKSGATSVAIKMVKANAPESDKRDLKSQLELMKTLKPHPHVIKLLGCVTESEPLLVLIEFVPYGDLLGYLRKSRGLNDTYYKDPDVKPKTSLTSQQLMKFAWQIADGMTYLSLKKVIHRDLAARNVLVGENETCKITDFGMARDVQEENIYERKTKGRLPVKWTAYESLLYGQYTTKSDVWSYGVVLYEISTIGGSPYPRIEGRKIVSLLQQGYRMPKPEHVDNELYQIMMNCWQSEPEARPSFNDLTQQLKRMENQHKNLIKMHIYDNTLYANLEDLNA